MDIGERLKNWQTINHISTKEIIELGIPQSSWSLYLSNKKLINTKSLIVLANKFDTFDMEYILTGKHCNTIIDKSDLNEILNVLEKYKS